MATYIITPVSGVKVNGCAEVTHIKTFYTAFGENDFAFVRKKALRGILEEVVIKELLIDRLNSIVTYKDTWNGLWNEDELIPEADAIDLAITYYEWVIETELRDLELCS